MPPLNEAIRDSSMFNTSFKSKGLFYALETIMLKGLILLKISNRAATVSEFAKYLNGGQNLKFKVIGFEKHRSQEVKDNLVGFDTIRERVDVIKAQRAIWADFRNCRCEGEVLTRRR